jgi:hypothetical protein
MAINVNIPSQFREYANLAAFPATGSAKILYVAKNTNKLYRWDTSAYVEVSASAASSWGNITGTLSNQTDLQSAINGKQDTLVSGTNIKTVNSTSILGSGDLAVQDTLVSGTNIKTINGSSVLGSGDLVVSGGGASGIHAFVKPQTGDSTSASINATALSTMVIANSRLYAYPFIPVQSITCSSLYINCSTLQSGALGRILIYSDLNGLPNTKLYESANLDLSTTGLKTATTTFTFNAGTTYWLSFHGFGTPSIQAFVIASVIPLRLNGISLSSQYFATSVPSFGSAPSPFGAVTGTNTSVPFIGITI